jgi:SAM-dependent methyltransferase
MTLRGATLGPLEEVRRRRLIIDRLDAWLYAEITPYLGQRVLEVGSGHGNLIRHLLDRDLVVATDIDPGSVDLIRRRFARYASVHARLYDVCEPHEEDMREFRLDTVVSLNVLEHLGDDVAALSNMAKLLWQGGRVIVIVPAHQSLYGTMDRSIGHMRRYSKQTLARKAADAGLTIERQFYVNLVGALGWFLNGRLLRQTVPPRGQLAWFNRLVPLVQWVEQRVRPPIGVSLVSIARQDPAK